MLRLFGACVLLVVAGGCRTFPLSLYVDDAVFEELERTSYREEVDDEEIAAALQERLGWSGERRTVDRETFWRVDLELSEGARPKDLDDPTHPLLAGLRSGDVILAKNPKPQSLCTTLGMREFTFYNHLGFFVIEEERAWVYEAWPKLVLFGFADHFVDRFRGEVGRRPLSVFLERYETLEFVRFPDEARNQRAVEAARESVLLEIPYDPQHDPDCPALSCSEYLELLLIEKGGYPFEIEPVALGHSDALSRIADSLGWHSPGYVVPDRFRELPGARSVGMLSHRPEAIEQVAQRAAFAVMYGHTHSDSPAGDYLAIHPWSFLRYRKSTSAFLEWSAAWLLDHPDESGGGIRRVFETIHDVCFRPTGE